MRHPIALVFALAAVLTAARLDAQPGSIVVNPDAVKLKLFWAMEGAEHGDQVGKAIGAIDDIDNDGRDEILINRGLWGEWNLYFGDRVQPRLALDWKYDSCRGFTPVAGRVLGGTDRYLILTKFVSLQQSHLHLLKIDSGRIAKTPSMVWRGRRSDRPELRAHLDNYTVADLDGDGADELICFILFVDGEPRPYHSQIWIYRGGEQFQLEQPDVVLRDEFEFDGFDLSTLVGHLDSDGEVDIAFLQRYGNRPNRFSIWFGNGALPTTGQSADRILDVTFDLLRTADVDGDSVVDLIAQGLVFRSRTTKSPRTRSYDDSDVDATVSASRGNKTQIYGPLNNRSGHFDMSGSSYYDNPNGLQLLAFSGSPVGPDDTNDAVMYMSDHGFMAPVASNMNGPVGDVNGDGWQDFICSDPQYYDPGIDKGIVVIIAGGPYIPVDDPSMGVREIVTGERPRALFVWPNPVRDHLNIAWRGDLRRPPSRFEIVDARGIEIATGEVGPDAGAAIWRCGDVAEGAYLLRVLDGQGGSIGVASIRKE